MNEGGYSLDKFRQAQREGRDDLAPDEKDFLDRYRKTTAEMRRDVAFLNDPTRLPNPLKVAAYLFVDMLNKDRREVLFGAGKAIDLEKKQSETMAGQIDLAHDEAKGLNEEYDRRVDAVKRAIEGLDEFTEKLNSEKGLEEPELGHDERWSGEAQDVQAERVKLRDEIRDLRAGADDRESRFEDIARGRAMITYADRLKGLK